MWWYTLVFIYALVLATCASSDKDTLLVRTSSGEVRGHRDPDGDIFSFYGIPYATAPTGTNRFKAPLPPPAWLQPIDAINTGVICPQATLWAINIQNTTMQENCLIANIFVPDTDDKNLPVLVMVHGGAFQMGFGDMFKAKQLIKAKKLVAVSFNYRLGVHGFLCLGTKDVPGNAGMKDQVALLRWVKQNIANFGGNPDDVTISGGSAGSASVDLLLLSKSAKGLFKRVIADSGSHVAAFTVQRDPLENAKLFAKQLDPTINVNDVYALEKLYKTVSFEQLVKDNFMNKTDSTFAFSPCVERHISGEEIFLDNDPVNIIQKGDYIKLPLLYSFANMEGLFRIDVFDSWKSKMNENFTDFLPADLQFKTSNEREAIAKTIKEFYFGDQPVSNENVLAYVDYFTDVIFAYPTLRSIRMQVEGGHDKIYLYEYSFVDDSEPLVPHTSVRGANHCAHTIAVLDVSYLVSAKASEKLQKMKSILSELWTNFIITGTPAPKGSSFPDWPPVGNSWSPHMSLGQTVELKGSLLEHRTRFWDNIYDKYYRPPISPPVPQTNHLEL